MSVWVCCVNIRWTMIYSTTCTCELLAHKALLLIGFNENLSNSSLWLIAILISKNNYFTKFNTCLESEFFRFINFIWADSSLEHIGSLSDKFQSINQIYFAHQPIDEATIVCIKQFWATIEIVRLRGGSFEMDILRNESLLVHFGNLKRLFVGKINENDTLLHHTYPNLEYFTFKPSFPHQMNELSVFFKCNPNVQRFLTTSECLWKYKDEFLQSTAQMDIVFLKIDECTDSFFEAIWNLLNRLHEQGFYKRFHFQKRTINREYGEKLASLEGLSRLFVTKLSWIHALRSLTNLVELQFFIWDDVKDSEMENLAKNLVNLKHLSIVEPTHNHIMAFVRQSTNLRKLKLVIRNLERHNGGIIKLSTLNNEREKFTGAQKLMIYVADNIFWQQNGPLNTGT